MGRFRSRRAPVRSRTPADRFDRPGRRRHVQEAVGTGDEGCRNPATGSRPSFPKSAADLRFCGDRSSGWRTSTSTSSTTRTSVGEPVTTHLAAPSRSRGIEEALWSSFRHIARMGARSLHPVGLDLVRDDGEVLHVSMVTRSPRSRGRPGEIALYLSGRKDAARVEHGWSEAAEGRSEGLLSVSDQRRCSRLRGEVAHLSGRGSPFRRVRRAVARSVCAICVVMSMVLIAAIPGSASPASTIGTRASRPW